MQSHERQLLQCNIEPLANAIGKHFADVSKLLLIKETFTPAMMNHIQKNCPDGHSRNLLLVNDLQTRGPTAFRDFVEVLELTGCIEALKIVSPRSLIREHGLPGTNGNGNRGTNGENNDNGNGRRRYVPTSYPLGLFSYNFHTIGSTKHNSRSDGEDDADAHADDDHDRGLPKQASNYSCHQSGDNNEGSEQVNNQQNFSKTGQHQNVERPPVLLHWHPYTSNHQRQANKVLGGNETKHSSIIDSSQDEMDRRNNMRIQRSLNAIQVKMSIVFQDDPKECYKMTAKPRGLCLIINNVEFNDDEMPQRLGSDIDAARFEKIFEQLWFQVHHERNLTANQMNEAINRIANMCQDSHDALIVIMLSHGSENFIYGSDGLQVETSDIFSRFDNERCEKMKGKPKVFIFQACRGDLVDLGEVENEHDTPQEHDNDGHCHSDLPTPLFTRTMEFSGNPTSRSLLTDMLICYSCLPGYVSVRNEITGSWLGAALAHYLTEFAWEKNFQQILAMVNEDFEGKISRHGHKQTPEIKYLGWKKMLYFNPGIYRT